MIKHFDHVTIVVRDVEAAKQFFGLLEFNGSRIATVVCVPLTSNLKWAMAPGNVLLSARMTGLPKESAANVSQLVTLDKSDLTERVGKLARSKLELVFSGIDVVLGR